MITIEYRKGFANCIYDYEVYSLDHCREMVNENYEIFSEDYADGYYQAFSDLDQKKYNL